MSSIGNNIKKRREAIPMSVEELSRKTGITASTLYRYENGEIKTMKTGILKTIALALRTTPADLMMENAFAVQTVAAPPADISARGIPDIDAAIEMLKPLKTQTDERNAERLTDDEKYLLDLFRRIPEVAQQAVIKFEESFIK